MGSQLPALYFYCGDLWKDNAFRLCGWQAQNLWIRMCVLLHEHTPRGEFRLASGEPMSDEHVARLCQMPASDFASLSSELSGNHVFSRIAGAIASRRMVREREAHERKAEAGREGAAVKWQRYKQAHGKQPSKDMAQPPTYSLSLSSSSVSEKEKDKEFDQFWEAYPKKVGKLPAHRAWHKMIDPPPIQEILKALEVQKKSKQWQEGFIPNPATWLNQERWNDEPVAPGKKMPPPFPPKNDPIARGAWKKTYGDPKAYGYE